MTLLGALLASGLSIDDGLMRAVDRRLRPFCPDTQLIAARIGEMESPTTRKVVRAVHNAAVSRGDGYHAGVQILREEQYERAAGAYRICLRESSHLCLRSGQILDSGIVGSIVVEGPAES